MADIDELIRLDDEENQRELAFIRSQLSSELKDTFSDDDILYLMETIVDYYCDSGLLDSADEEVDIDLEQVAENVCRMAEEAQRGPYSPQDVFFIVQADLDFQEQSL